VLKVVPRFLILCVMVASLDASDPFIASYNNKDLRSENTDTGITEAAYCCFLNATARADIYGL